MTKWGLPLLLLFLNLACSHEPVNERISLNANWQFSPLGNSHWQEAKVPGSVQMDLLRKKQIPHPFLLNNEDSIQWVSETHWEYKTRFRINDSTLQKQKHILQFDGLDTYASVYLNDSLLLKTNNAFRRWEHDISDLLLAENALRIVFESPDSIERSEALKLNYELPEAPRVFTRKPQFQYGWDWGPTLKTMGIWRDISLLSYENVRLKDAFVKTESVSDTLALLTALVELETVNKDEITVVVRNNTTGDSFEEHITLSPGIKEYSVPVSIEDPELWWTHDLGEPFLYDFSITIKKNNDVLQKLHKKVGVRTIQLITEKDPLGESFYFKLNDRPVFMKGANYIPPNIFLSETTEKDYQILLNDVTNANMNMLRIWGGGIYENDTFYDLCDEKGILLWQDFMYACAMYPGDPDFLENAKQEAIDNVKRLRQHPSIGLWCGNNENSEGWHRWGWKDAKTEVQQQEIWNGYYALFNHILPKVVDSLHPSVSYWESSPKFGRGDKRYASEGDAHDWWVWHDGYPFEHFEENVPRFMSEFGFQSFPSLEAIRYFTQQDSINLIHPSFANHQKHARGFQLIDSYMKQYYPVPEDAKEYVYVSQLLQAYGITKGIYAHRAAKPYTMGSLYWQLNDCWPVVSWSGIDGLGNWKALHYRAKDAFKNIIIVPRLKNDTLQIHLVDDNLKPASGRLNIAIKDFKGEILFEKSVPSVATSVESSQVVFEIFLKEFSIDYSSSYADVRFGDTRRIFFFVKPKDLQLISSEVSTEIESTKDGFEIRLTSESLQKNVFLQTDEAGRWSDNYFDLPPGEERVVQFNTTTKKTPKIRILTLNQIMSN
ncbi:beta-mannosidase [Constantimarinum furrinae]|uniref:Beta-mannosidase B n=1 Tax=Constantimarinum furrinae TaxID=2562285 RepID=A0A7G8PTB9_9FLAO|nr:glycoside hydrolase family 2 protein [Constantimarinum furrinae]QNJ97585.1 beta-mannosidase [Constantimarinum furrinae]